MQCAHDLFTEAWAWLADMSLVPNHWPPEQVDIVVPEVWPIYWTKALLSRLIKWGVTMAGDAPDTILFALLLAQSAKLSFSGFARCLLTAQLTLQASDLAPEQVYFIRELLILCDQLCCKGNLLLKQVLRPASCQILCQQSQHCSRAALLCSAQSESSASHNNNLPQLRMGLTTVFCRAAVLASLFCSLAASAVGPSDRAMDGEAQK